MREERVEIPIKVSLRPEKQFSASFGEVKLVHTDNYEDLYGKPRINDVELIGNKTSEQLKLQDRMIEVSESEIDDILYGGG